MIIERHVAFACSERLAAMDCVNDCGDEQRSMVYPWLLRGRTVAFACSEPHAAIDCAVVPPWLQVTGVFRAAPVRVTSNQRTLKSLYKVCTWHVRCFCGAKPAPLLPCTERTLRRPWVYHSCFCGGPHRHAWASFTCTGYATGVPQLSLWFCGGCHWHTRTAFMRTGYATETPCCRCRCFVVDATDILGLHSRAQGGEGAP